MLSHDNRKFVTDPDGGTGRLPSNPSPSLPVVAFKEQILTAVDGNAVTIVTAETGAGKSTQIPKWLLEEGYRVIVTQPRRLAVRALSARVAEEMHEPLGGIVGYRTGEDRRDSAQTRCLFCTDGLALIRELMGQGGGRDVLVLDEIHEWNLNLEILVGWIKHELAQGATFKVVLMSATMDAEKLSSFFEKAPVITVPGRSFPVESRVGTGSLEDSVASEVKTGKNVLVFRPGKSEIRETIARLQQLGVDAEILPLHGEVEPSDQARCFQRYSRPKVVVATGIAETSITIDDIDVVIDDGLEKRKENVDGVEGLYTRPISMDKQRQRAGRAGRTKPGVAIDFCGAADRPAFSTPEIQRVRLDMSILRLLIAGIDMENLELFHQPRRETIVDAKRSLTLLGCIDKAGNVTAIGREVAKLPLAAHVGRMVVEAKRLGVVEDVVTIAAIIEEGGIIDRKSRAWRALAPEETSSDLLAQLAVFKAAKDFRGDAFRAHGIFAKSYFRVKEIVRNIKNNAVRQSGEPSSGKPEDILKAVCAGMVDRLYRYDGYGSLTRDYESRVMAMESVVQPEATGSWVVGVPFDLEVRSGRRPTVLKLLSLASRVEPEWLMEVAPQLCREEPGLNARYDQKRDVVTSKTFIFFNGVEIASKEVDDPTHPRAHEIFADSLRIMNELNDPKLVEILETNRQLLSRAHDLNVRAGEKIFFEPDFEEHRDLVRARLAGARNIKEIKDVEALRFGPIDESRAEEVLRQNPDTIEIPGVGTRAIDYGSSGAVIDGSIEWEKLPDDGIFLPSGRRVSVELPRNLGSMTPYTDIRQAKEIMARGVIEETLKAFAPKALAGEVVRSKQEFISIGVVPEITEVEFGKHPLTGQPLIAYKGPTSPFDRVYMCLFLDYGMAARSRAVLEQLVGGAGHEQRPPQSSVDASALQEKRTAEEVPEKESARGESPGAFGRDPVERKEVPHSMGTEEEISSPLDEQPEVLDLSKLFFGQAKVVRNNRK